MLQGTPFPFSEVALGWPSGLPSGSGQAQDYSSPRKRVPDTQIVPKYGDLPLDMQTLPGHADCPGQACRGALKGPS